MNMQDLLYFNLLKKELEKKYKKEYSSCNIEIVNWRQQEINRFQELLLRDVKGQISEKWFYTHIKTKNNEKLPRIDTLNLLCKFLEYDNWHNFKDNNIISEKEYNKKNKSVNQSYFIKHKFKLISGLALITLTILILSAISLSAQIEYKFCFIDADTKELITDNKIEISVLHDNQSPELFTCDKNACFKYKSENNEVSFIVNTPYYETDTITRKLINNTDTEIVKLKTDDYALMLHIFSKSKIEDWKKRRNTLDKIFADNAQIIQIDKLKRGIELYNKEDFINKMTMPLNSLKNIEIIKTEYLKDKIIKMRFTQTQTQ